MIVVRLISEVFANILVIGILLGAAGSNTYTLTILAFAGVTLFYSTLGDLHKYTKLLYICISILVLGCLSYWLGGLFNRSANSRVKA